MQDYKIYIDKDVKKVIYFSKGEEEENNIEFKLETIDTKKLLLDEITSLMPQFKKWYIDLIFKYNKKKDYEIITKQLEKIYKYTDYFTDNYIDLSQFVNITKKTKSSIFFDNDEIKKVYKLTVILKLLSPIYGTADCKKKIKKDLFNKVITEIGIDLINKIHSMIKSKMFRFSWSDKFMWKLIKTKSAMDEKTYLLIAFNYILSTVLATYNLKKNPIAFISSVTGEMIGWFLKDLKAELTIYEENINTINSQTITNIENKIIYNSLNRIEMFVYDKFKRIDGLDIKKVEELLENKSIKNGFLDCLILPLVSKYTDIPYSVLKQLPLKKKFMFQLFTYYLFMEIPEYKDLKFVDFMRLMINVKSQSQLIYRPKNLDLIFNNDAKFFNTNDKCIMFNIFNKIMISILKYTNTPFFGNKISKIKCNEKIKELEKDIIIFIRFVCRLDYKNDEIYTKLKNKYIELLINE